MEKIKGYKYTIEGHSKIEDFALAILKLVNVRSSVKNTIYDVETVDGTNLIIVVTFAETDFNMDEYLATHGKVTNKEEVYMLDVTFNDFKSNVEKEINAVDQKYYDDEIGDYYIGFEIFD